MNLFTVDIDWAPDPVIADTLALFEQHSVKCTLFATHSSRVIEGCNRALFEVAIHPNFNPLVAGKEGDPGRIMDEMQKIYPDARGIRSHSMTQSTPLLDLFQRRGMVYEANQFLPYWTNIRPFRLWNGLLRIPYNWEDDIHFLYGKSFNDAGIAHGSAMNVFDFHPVHIYLNTDSAECYRRARSYYHDAARLVQMRNNDSPGTRTLLLQLLEQQGPSTTLGAVAAQYQV